MGQVNDLVESTPFRLGECRVTSRDTRSGQVLMAVDLIVVSSISSVLRRTWLTFRKFSRHISEIMPIAKPTGVIVRLHDFEIKVEHNF